MTMEALEEPLVTNTPEEGVKDNGNDELIENAEASLEMDICHTSNGVVADSNAVVELKNEQDTGPVVETTVADDEHELAAKFEEDYDSVNEAMETEVSSAPVEEPVYGDEFMEPEISSEIQEPESSGVEHVEDNVDIETEVLEESVVELDGIVDNNAGNITFETEIFIENNASELEDETVTSHEPDSSNILNELGQNIELSDVLRSSDVSETVENNNCEQEVFNKEELLDILEGNDVEQSRKIISENFHADSQKLEEHLAMKQLNKLKYSDTKKKNRCSPKKPEKKQPKRSSSNYVLKETKAKVDEKMSPKEAKAKSDEPTSSKVSPKESKSKGDEPTSLKLSTKEAKSKDESTSSKVSPKEAKPKGEEPTISKLSTKEAKAKGEEPNNSKTSLKEAKPKIDEATSAKVSPKEAKSKTDEITSSKTVVKGAKAKVENTVGSSSATKLDESDGSKPAKEVKGRVEEIVSSNDAIIDGVEKVEEALASDAPKETKRKAEDKKKSQNLPKTMKANDKHKNNSIVNALVQDWSDDENMEPDESNTLLDESEALLESTSELVKTQDTSIQEDNTHNESQEGDSTVNNAEVSASDGTTPNNKSADETQPQRRLGRVIKKKVIYDPDNPDTFTKTKIHVKKEKEALPDKDQSLSTPKKVKADQPPQATKTKSPISKMQWKKPQPKNSKQSVKRLTEIDRLLMDEGAVNMICQLTPEALKGNKNMKSRAEYIKNIQSNTPDTKEMKFRERKNKIKAEGDPKKLGTEKHRLSLSGSVKSPAVSEDFENHSADDSIIYRRHSSSSYSSSCMSPRRLSDVEGPASQMTHRECQGMPRENQDASLIGTNRQSVVFMDEKTSTPRKDIMNKSDCLSIKEKLNSKLSRALNKRKLSGFKSDKPSKVKKVVTENEITVNTDVTLNFNQKIAEICIQKTGSLFSIQIMKVLENILLLVDSNKDIAVTLITSECGTVCSGLDLKPLLEDVKHAHEIADQARSLMHAMENHSKLLIVGVEGKTLGFSLALSALSDVLLASENASFALSARCNAVLYPGSGVLTSRGLPQNLLNDLILFGKELSATEALNGGLVSRVVWPERFQEQVCAIAMDIAAQPNENIMLKKQLLGLKKSGSAATFQSCLEKERNLLVSYWTSAEGLQLLRTNLDAA